MPVKVLLDTDIGSDIDDAVALAYLLANPECRLMGITTVTGEAHKRAELASVLCRAAGRQVPIMPGAELPLLIEQAQPRAPQSAALERWPHDADFPQGQAVDFLRRTIRANPGEIVLLSIGPLTNIALLFAMDPGIPALLKGMMSMCGVFTNRAAGWGPREWNAMVDPHATAIVYRHHIPFHRSIGLDVTSRVSLDAAELKSRFQADILKPVLDFAKVWFRHADRVVFHDPLAAAALFNPDICGYQRGTVDVELASPRLSGLTHWTPDPSGGRHEVALEVNAGGFFERFFSVFT